MTGLLIIRFRASGRCLMITAIMISELIKQEHQNCIKQ